MSNHFATKHGKRKRFRSKVKCTTEGNTLNVDSTVATASNESHYNSTRTTTTSGPSTAVECTEKDCTRQFDSLVDMRRHLVSAHGLFRLSCRAKGCSQKFTKNIHLRCHQTKAHAQGGDFDCPACGATSTSQEAARKHYNCHITGHFKCTRCLCFDRMISLSSAQSHLNNTGKMPTICETEKCDATFTSRSALDKHQYASHRGTYGQLSSCTFENCHLYSFHKEIMGEHVRTVHGNTQTPKLKRQPEWKREPEQRKKREVTDHDGQQCPPQGTLEPHSNGESVKVYSSVATVSNDLHDKSTTTASTSGQQSALFKCIQKDCSRHFTTLQGMKIHVTSIHPNLRFLCTANSECKKRFNSRSLLKQHLSKVHGQKGLYTCQADLCKALKFDSEAEVLLHMYNTAHHQSFKCGKCICFKWMAKISTAKRHWKRVNTPGGELKCMMKCPSTFHSKSQLDAHRNVAHARCSVVVCCTFHQDCLMCCSDVFRMWEHLRTVHHVNGQFTDLISKYTKTLNLNSEDK